MTDQAERDEQAIIRTLNRYGLAMDTQSWDLFDLTFTQDVLAEYPGATWTDLPAFKKDFAASHAKYEATQHMVTMPVVEVEGDSASSFCYTKARLILRGTPGGDFFECLAWNDDSWVRTPKGWLIRERRCRILWADGNPAILGLTSLFPGRSLIGEAAEGKVGALNLIKQRA